MDSPRLKTGDVGTVFFNTTPIPVQVAAYGPERSSVRCICHGYVFDIATDRIKYPGTPAPGYFPTPEDENE